MKWVEEKPNNPGWYWTDYEYIQVVEIKNDPFYNYLYFNSSYEDENSDGNLQTYFEEIRVDKINCKWSNKLQEPK